MKTNLRSVLAVLVLGSVAAYAQSTPGNNGMGAGTGSMNSDGKDNSPTTPGAGHRPEMPEMGPKFDTSTLPQSVQDMLSNFDKDRTQLMTDHEALLAKLKGATETERKQLVSDFLASEKTLLDQQKTLAKQIRDEIRTLRRTQAGTTSGG